MKYNFQELLVYAIIASKKAGDAIIEVYNADFTVEKKSDNSPLTIADKRAHRVIEETVRKQYPEIPFLSEEGRDIPYEERKQWKYLWLVDPLDGTKEFIKRNGEFTVNIALVEDHRPVLGVIYVPVKDTFYFGIKGTGSYRTDRVGNLCAVDDSAEGFDSASFFKNLIAQSIKLPTEIDNTENEIRVVGSRSHMNKETEEYIHALERKFKKVVVVQAGSSLKICLIAESLADVYPRFAPTMEWDTAAGQIIAEGAGCIIQNTNTRQPLEYNKQDLYNSWFIVEKVRST